MSNFYIGNDPLLAIINNYFYHVRKKENEKIFNSFKHQIRFMAISEDAVITSWLGSQYCNYIAKHHVIAENQQIQLYTQEQVNEQKFFSEMDGFLQKEYEFPIQETFRQKKCRCDGNSLSCPNCDTTKIVTCPECYSKRGGDCNACTGKGTITCSGCKGNKHCSACKGIPRCGDCSGSGKITCSGCSGSGKTKEQRSVMCTKCSGQGYTTEYGSSFDYSTNSYQYGSKQVQCGACYGSCRVSQSCEEQHFACNGLGRVNCSRCGGAGHCRTCNGSGNCGDCRGNGYLTCTKCNGSGNCRTCSGKGTKSCPTCEGTGNMTCPICVGTNLLTMYSSDIFQMINFDEKETTSSFFQSKWPYDFGGQINLQNLEDATVESELGIITDLIKKTAFTARANFTHLLDVAKKREINLAMHEPFVEQNSIYYKLVEKMDNSWKLTPSDSLKSNFLNSFSSDDREYPIYDHSLNSVNSTQGIIKKQLTYQESSHKLVPLSKINLEIDNKPMEIIGFGTKNNNNIMILDNKTELDFSNDLINLDQSRKIDTSNIEEKPSLTRTILTLGTQRTKKIIKLVLILGDEENFKLTIFKMFGETIHRMNLGKIDDPLFAQVVSNIVDSKGKISSSLAYSIKIDKHKTIILVNVHVSSLLQKNNQIKRMISVCDLIIWITKNSMEIKNITEGKYGGKLIGILLDNDEKIGQKSLKIIHYSSREFEKQVFSEQTKDIFYKDLIKPTLCFLFNKNKIETEDLHGQPNEENQEKRGMRQGN